MFTHIVVAVDFGDSSDGALEVAVGMARESGAQLTLVHSREVPLAAAAGSSVAEADFVSPAREAEVAQMKALCSSLKARHPRVDGFLREQSAVEGVLATAREAGADLIVVGTHGRQGLDRLLLGSVAEGVLRGAEVPVLVVRKKPPAR